MNKLIICMLLMSASAFSMIQDKKDISETLSAIEHEYLENDKLVCIADRGEENPSAKGVRMRKSAVPLNELYGDRFSKQSMDIVSSPKSKIMISTENIFSHTIYELEVMTNAEYTEIQRLSVKVYSVKSRRENIGSMVNPNYEVFEQKVLSERYICE